MKSGALRTDEDAWPVDNAATKVSPDEQMALAAVLSRGDEEGSAELFDRACHAHNAIFSAATERLKAEFPSLVDMFPHNEGELISFISLIAEGGSESYVVTREPLTVSAPRQQFDNEDIGDEDIGG